MCEAIVAPLQYLRQSVDVIASRSETGLPVISWIVQQPNLKQAKSNADTAWSVTPFTCKPTAT